MSFRFILSAREQTIGQLLDELIALDDAHGDEIGRKYLRRFASLLFPLRAPQILLDVFEIRDLRATPIEKSLGASLTSPPRAGCVPDFPLIQPSIANNQ